MKNLFFELSVKGITVKSFEEVATEILNNNDKFIPFASSEIMEKYRLPNNCLNDVNMLLSNILVKDYKFTN